MKHDSLRHAVLLALACAIAGPQPARANDDTEAPAPPAKSGPKVLVLPYQPIYRSVEQGKVQTATELLNKELNEKDSLVIIRGAVAAGGDAAKPSLESARAAAQAAQTAEAARDLAAAIPARQKAIAAYEANAAAIETVDEFVLAYHYLARAQLWAADDDAAKKTMEVAARMLPTFVPPAKDFSRLYRAWLGQIAERVVKERRGEVFVKSGLPGARISLDGRPMDVAPVVLNKVVPGRHLVQAEVEGVPRFGGILEVQEKSRTEFVVSFVGSVGGDAVGDVADAIARNEIPKAAVRRAADAGKTAGAQFVVAGGLAKDEDHFNVHTFLVDVGQTAIATLDPVEFDLDLLTAESDVLKIVQSIDSAVSSFADSRPAIAQIENRLRAQSTVNEVDASPAAAAERTGPTRAANKGRRKVFKPLKGGSIIIKDEEE